MTSELTSPIVHERTPRRRLWMAIGCVWMLISMSAANTVVASSVRTWSDSTGQRHAQATFIGYNEVDRTVQVRRAGSNRRAQVKFDRLSEQDKKYVQSQTAALQKSAERRPSAPVRFSSANRQQRGGFPPPYRSYHGPQGIHHQAGQHGTGFYYDHGDWWMVNVAFHEEQPLHWIYSSEEVKETYWGFAKQSSPRNYYAVWFWNPVPKQWRLFHFARVGVPVNQTGTR